jgi:hypothetical protein
VLQVVNGEPRVGVVLSRDADGTTWVVTAEAEVRRSTAQDLRPFTGLVPHELASHREDALFFATLRERTDALVRTPRGSDEPVVVVEKCRFGALVARADGSLLAVGFGSFVPAPSGTVH